MCFGECPVYTLTIRGDGSVMFDGQKFVAATGVHTSTLAPEQLQALVEAFQTADYFALDDSYTNENVTDLPSVYTSITLNGKTKRINHYYGNFCTPQQLSDLESTIDAIANTSQWLKPTPAPRPTRVAGLDETSVLPTFPAYSDLFECNEP